MRQQWVSTTYKLSRNNIYEDKKPITNDVYEDIFEVAKTEYNNFINHPQAISFTCTLYDRSCTIEKPKWPHKSFTFTFNDSESAMENVKVEDGFIAAYYERYILRKITSKSWRAYHNALNKLTVYSVEHLRAAIKELLAYRAARSGPSDLRDLQQVYPGAYCGVTIHLASKTEYVRIIENTPDMYHLEFYSVIFKGQIKPVPGNRLFDTISSKISCLLRGFDRDSIVDAINKNKYDSEAFLLSAVANYLEFIPSVPLHCGIIDNKHYLRIVRHGDCCDITIERLKNIIDKVINVPSADVSKTVLSLFRKHFKNSSACEEGKLIGAELAKDTVNAKKQKHKSVALRSGTARKQNEEIVKKATEQRRSLSMNNKENANNGEILTALEGRLINANPEAYSGIVYLNLVVWTVMEDPDNGLDWYSKFARYYIHRSVYDNSLFDVEIVGFGRPRFETLSKLSSFEDIVDSIILDDYVFSYAPDKIDIIAFEKKNLLSEQPKRNPFATSKFVDINKNLTRGDKEGIVYAFVSDFKRSDYILSTLILIPYCVTVIKTDKAGGGEGSFSYIFYRGFGAKVEEGTATADDLFDQVLEKVLSLNIEDANCGVNLIAKMQHSNDIVVDLTGLDESDRFTKIRTELSKFYKDTRVICFINGDSHLSVAAHGEEYMISISAPDAADTDMVSKDELLEYILSHIN